MLTLGCCRYTGCLDNLQVQFLFVSFQFAFDKQNHSLIKTRPKDIWVKKVWCVTSAMFLTVLQKTKMCIFFLFLFLRINYMFWSCFVSTASHPPVTTGEHYYLAPNIFLHVLCIDLILRINMSMWDSHQYLFTGGCERWCDKISHS